MESCHSQKESWKPVPHIMPLLLTRGEHITFTETSDWCQCDTFLAGMQEREIYLFLKALPLSGALITHFSFPGSHLLTILSIFSALFLRSSKEKFIAMLLFLMWELWLHKVHHRLAEGPWCVVCLSLVSAGFGMSQGDELGNKQVGERIGQSAAWWGCVCHWLRDLINVLSLLTPFSSSTKPPGVLMGGWIPSPPPQERALEPSAWETPVSSPHGRNTKPTITHTS